VVVSKTFRNPNPRINKKRNNYEKRNKKIKRSGVYQEEVK